MEWRHFTELKSIDKGFKSFNAADVMPVIDIGETGTVLKSSYSKSKPIFLPVKATGKTLPFAVPAIAGKAPYVSPDNSIFAG